MSTPTEAPAKKGRKAVDRRAGDSELEALEEYLTSKEQVDRLRVYNQNLTNLVRDQQEQLSSIDRQMKDTFPGLKRCYAEAGKYLFDKDFFGVKNATPDQIASLSLLAQ